MQLFPDIILIILLLLGQLHIGVKRTVSILLQSTTKRNQIIYQKHIYLYISLANSCAPKGIKHPTSMYPNSV